MPSDCSKTRFRVDITNLLRTMATLFVFTLHGRGYVEGIDSSGFLYVLTSLPAWAGVWIFLFLSGYTLGLGFFSGHHSLRDENGRLSARCFGKFYLQRFLKLAPLYYIYCFLLELLFGDRTFFYYPDTMLRMLTFTFNGIGGTSGLGHLWYISTAMQMYLIMPFFYLIIQKIKSASGVLTTFFLILVGGLSLRVALYTSGADWYSLIYTSAFCNLDLVLCGMLLASFKSKFHPRSSNGRFIRILTGLMLVSLVIYNMVIYDGTDKGLAIYRYYLPSVYILVCSAAIVVFADLSYRVKKVTWSSLRKNPFEAIDWFSSISYGFYIFHIAVFHYISAVLGECAFYTEGTVGLQCFAFLGYSFLASLACAMLFHRMCTVFSAKKSHAVQKGGTPHEK